MSLVKKSQNLLTARCIYNNYVEISVPVKPTSNMYPTVFEIFCVSKGVIVFLHNPTSILTSQNMNIVDEIIWTWNHTRQHEYAAHLCCLVGSLDVDGSSLGLGTGQRLASLVEHPNTSIYLSINLYIYLSIYLVILVRASAKSKAMFRYTPSAMATSIIVSNCHSQCSLPPSAPVHSRGYLMQLHHISRPSVMLTRMVDIR